ncbi:MAG: hypothetical protein U0269_31905 [Polyangiales bacterium]
MQNLLRFIDLVRRELNADDARVEIGGREPDPEDETHLIVALADSQRLVVSWDRAPSQEQRAKARDRLSALIESFAPSVSRDSVTPSLKLVSATAATNALDEALGLLARRSRAEEAIVIDHASPEVWGSSEVPRDAMTVDDAVVLSRTAAGLASIGESLSDLVALDDNSVRDRLKARGVESLAEHTHARSIAWARALGSRASESIRLRAARAIAATRAMEHGAPPPEDLWMLVRPFANIYRLVLLFDGPPSALHVEAALLKMLPHIERLVLGLPPRDPVTRGAKVTPMRRLRPV